MIDMYLLEALVALKEHGTLSAAAEHLMISQPALSRAMKKLEDVLEVSLFERTKNKIVLNETGELTAVYAKKILDAQHDMIHTVRSFDRNLHTIAIGSCAPGPQLEIPLLLTRSYPQENISSEVKDVKALIRGLHENIYAMIVLPHPYTHEDCLCWNYGSEQLYVSVVPAHPLSSFMTQGVYFKDLDGSTFVEASQIGLWQFVEEKMPHSQFIKMDNMNHLNEIVNTSSLFGFATDLTIRLYRRQQNPQRIFIPINDQEATLTYYCIIKKDNRKLRPLVSMLRQELL
ncbi:MAG: LysR family transcriptional regulator [bacterium]